jgi:hypothetical protein
MGVGEKKKRLSLRYEIGRDGQNRYTLLESAGPLWLYVTSQKFNANRRDWRLWNSLMYFVICFAVVREIPKYN